MAFGAVYEDGVLKLLERLTIPNLEHVLVTISGAARSSADIRSSLNPRNGKPRNMTTFPEEVRRALSSIPGSLADAVIASREEPELARWSARE